MAKYRKRLPVALGLVFAALFMWMNPLLGQPSAQGSPLIEVSMSGGIRGSTAVYSIMLKNTSSSPVQDIFIAGGIPAGATLDKAVDTPAGTWFRGFEAAGTSLQSAVWLAGGIPAGGTLGPFTYVVNRGTAADLKAHAFVHFRLPNDGTALSLAYELSQTAALGMQVGGSFHDTHVKRVGLGCDTCHGGNAAGYSDPLANVSNPVDKKACLGCHGAGSKPFFGDKWDTVRIW